MSLHQVIVDLLASCVHVPQYSVLDSFPPALYRVTMSLGANRPYWTNLVEMELIFDCPSPPATFKANFYERRSTGASTDPIASVEGFLATCAQPSPGLGTSDWLWMATLTARFANGAALNPEWVHIMHYTTASDSIGVIRYPNNPPT